MRTIVLTARLCFSLIALTVVMDAQCNSYSCTQCFNNYYPMTGHGSAPDGSGRRLYNVYIDSSWGNPTNTTIYNATNDAISAWNSATDPSCQGGAGSQTGYYLQLNQSAGSGPADIVVVKDDSILYCAVSNLSSSSPAAAPQSVYLRSTVATASESQAAEIIEHEFGHLFGLDDCGGACSSASSLMCIAAPLTTCIPTPSRSVQPSDIGQSNRNLSNKSTCTSNLYSSQGVYTTSCPSDNGCSGYDSNGYAITNPDYCQFVNGCQSGWYTTGGGGDPGAMCCWWASSPILIDLSGDGFDLTDAQHGVPFDLDNSGVRRKFSWTAPGVLNGWPALDRNGNGRIDSGEELFGNVTPQPPSKQPNGFLALSVFDLKENGGNENGRIDSGDRIFGSLLIWIDVNHNGISEPQEIHHLSEFGIESISLEYTLSNWTDQYGNAFRFKAKIDFADKPGDRWTYDVLLLRAN